MKLPEITHQARDAAIEVLHHNIQGPCQGLPRTAGWGYPEPYTRDWMIAALGILPLGDDVLTAAVRRVMESLAANQTSRGHIPSLAHDSRDLGASDTTPLFLIGVALYRRATGDSTFCEDAVQRALTWMHYQSPEDLIMVAQQPTSDWRDEQWVLGYGLYVNSLVYTYLRLYGLDEDADRLKRLMHCFDVPAKRGHRRVHEGLAVQDEPFYAMWAYKVYNSERFDLLGNCIAVISGLASRARARRLVRWIEAECAELRAKKLLALDLPPCLFPYIRPKDPDWRPRYAEFNQPATYHNGGVWPFICGFYVAALVAAGRNRLAVQKLEALARLVQPARERKVEFGFNEWFNAATGKPGGQDWQAWSAAMYLYAFTCVERGVTPYLGELRTTAGEA